MINYCFYLKGSFIIALLLSWVPQINFFYAYLPLKICFHLIQINIIIINKKKTINLEWLIFPDSIIEKIHKNISCKRYLVEKIVPFLHLFYHFFVDFKMISDG